MRGDCISSRSVSPCQSLERSSYALRFGLVCYQILTEIRDYAAIDSSFAGHVCLPLWPGRMQYKFHLLTHISFGYSVRADCISFPRGSPCQSLERFFD